MGETLRDPAPLIRPHDLPKQLYQLGIVTFKLYHTPLCGSVSGREYLRLGNFMGKRSLFCSEFCRGRKGVTWHQHTLARTSSSSVRIAVEMNVSGRAHVTMSTVLVRAHW